MAYHAPVVGYCISTKRARDLVVDAIHHAGAQPRPIAVERMLSFTHDDVCCHALVWDFELPGGDSVQLVNTLRADHPYVPVLAYLPVKPDSERYTIELLRIGGVTTKLQFPDSAERLRLKAVVLDLVNGIPAARIGRLMRLLLGDISYTAAGFLSTSITLVCQQMRPRLPPVWDVARRCGVTSRSLERILRAEGLPPPRRILEWILLLSLAERAAGAGGRTVTEARRMGLSGNALYRLRNRLLPNRVRPFKVSPQQEFDLALLEFAKRCGVHRKHARAVLEQSEIWRSNRVFIAS